MIRGFLAVAFVLGAHSVFAADARTITIFEGRQMSVDAPRSWIFQEGTDPHLGAPTLRLEDSSQEILLQITFLPDSNSKLSSKESVEAEATRILKPFLATAVEKEIRLTFDDAGDGMAAYASFTDSKLDPKHIPEDEKLIGVSGIRTWKGGYLVFTILTNSTDSKTYKRALDVVLSGIHQVKAPIAF
jgi:hypothetical protein